MIDGVGGGWTNGTAAHLPAIAAMSTVAPSETVAEGCWKSVNSGRPTEAQSWGDGGVCVCKCVHVYV